MLSVVVLSVINLPVVMLCVICQYIVQLNVKMLTAVASAASHKHASLLRAGVGVRCVLADTILADIVYWATQMLADMYALIDHFVGQSPPPTGMDRHTYVVGQKWSVKMGRQPK